MKSWRDYPTASVRNFLKFYTDGDVGHGGSRYECAVCGSEFADHFGVKRCWQYYHGEGNLSDGGFDYEEHAIEIPFDENGEEIDG